MAECYFGCTQTKILVRSKWAVYQRATLPKLPREGLYSLFRMWYRKVQIRLFTVCWEGIMTCRQCSGDCVIWEESIDERPWEKARSISPLKMKEDDEVDNLDIKLDVKKKSKRVYQSPPPESLNAKTGLFSKRMKIIHRDPMLHAQRVAAIKKAKGTAAARKRASEALKVFFSDPENRRKRSIAMKDTVAVRGIGDTTVQN
ncbi:zinc knuckle CCHC-type family protein [Prunus dulcis]|uniref:Zinc knuckle CCHC-type family protein n=1 Tax=Prunus dulcis TaxID=3755 RepID=A0A4Y1QQT2_PRUDU|nr:zinc knuckle CCHC-type family protein [Prunus dulcis]